MSAAASTLLACWTPSTPPRYAAGAASGLAALRRHQHEIDELNVYPVPDGDTGTNLVLTLTSAQQALSRGLGAQPEDGTTAHGHALRLMARGALLGARGNSGVILSQLLRGLADALGVGRPSRGRALAGGAARRPPTPPTRRWPSRSRARCSVVVAAAADGRRAGRQRRPAHGGPGRGRGGRRGAGPHPASSCPRWPGPAWSTPVAGACACCSTRWSRWSRRSAPDAGPTPVTRTVRRRRCTAVRETGSAEFAYEVQYLLDAEPTRRSTELRATLGRLGDSLVVVGDRRTAIRRPGTCTCTSTTSGRRSRPGSRPAGRTGSR